MPILAALTKYHILVAYKQHTSILTVLETGKSKFKAMAALVSAS